MLRVVDEDGMGGFSGGNGWLKWVEDAEMDGFSRDWLMVVS